MKDKKENIEEKINLAFKNEGFLKRPLVDAELEIIENSSKDLVNFVRSKKTTNVINFQKIKEKIRINFSPQILGAMAATFVIAFFVGNQISFNNEGINKIEENNNNLDFILQGSTPLSYEPTKLRNLSRAINNIEYGQELELILNDGIKIILSAENEEIIHQSSDGCFKININFVGITETKYQSKTPQYFCRKDKN